MLMKWINMLHNLMTLTCHCDGWQVTCHWWHWSLWECNQALHYGLACYMNIGVKRNYIWIGNLPAILMDYIFWSFSSNCTAARIWVIANHCHILGHCHFPVGHWHHWHTFTYWNLTWKVRQIKLKFASAWFCFLTKQDSKDTVCDKNMSKHTNNDTRPRVAVTSCPSLSFW